MPTVTTGLRSGDQLGGAEGLERRDRLGDEGGLLFDDGVIDRSAEGFVEDFHAEQLRRSCGSVLVGAGDGDIEGKDLIGVPVTARSFLGGPLALDRETFYINFI